MSIGDLTAAKIVFGSPVKTCVHRWFEPPVNLATGSPFRMPVLYTGRLDPLEAQSFPWPLWSAHVALAEVRVDPAHETMTR